MMKHTRIHRAVSVILCLVLAAATALSAIGCNAPASSTDLSVTTTTVASATGVTVLGDGQTTFPFTVTDKDGAQTAFEIRTDKQTVGEALLELGLIAGDEGEFGLYVKTVNGITADYDTDGTYWAFYINGEYAMSGVDTTVVEAGASYEMRVEKG